MRWILTIALCLLEGACFGQAGKQPPTLEEFMRSRDAWLYEQACLAHPVEQPPSLGVAKTEARDAIQQWRDDIAEQRRLLDPIQKRIARNEGNKFLRRVVEKDKARAKIHLDAIAEAEKQIKDLAPKATEEQRLADLLKIRQAKALEKWNAEESARKDQREKNRAKYVSKHRSDLSLIPPGKATLNPAAFRVGHVGALPQWPIGIEKRLAGQQRAIHNAVVYLRKNELLNTHQRQLLEDIPGGIAAAKGAFNLTVVQVFDEHTALVSLIGSWMYDWPVFLVSGIDTSKLADDSMIKHDKLLLISRTHQYTSVSGASKTVFFLRPLSVDDFAGNDGKSQ